MLDHNNRPSGPNLIVTAKTAHKVHFLDAAIYLADGLKQIAAFPTGKSSMGFGFAADGKHGYLCCHDDGEVFEFELASGYVTRKFATAAGCEFIIAYE